jgi:soluble epoxide hydrolase/lipid-phosphate phosphatase
VTYSLLRLILHVQYIPSSGPFLLIEHLIPSLPRLSYQLFFDKQTSAAVVELNKDIRRTARATLRTVDSPPPSGFLESTATFLGGWSDVVEVRRLKHTSCVIMTVPQIPPIPFFTSDEEDYFVEQYAIQGFNNSMSFIF